MKKEIIIVGGGTAGWSTALFCNKYFHNFNVKLIESKEIPIIGVGEATTPHLVDFLNNLGIDLVSILKETNGTIKHAISFENWNGDKKNYFHPFNVKNNANPFSYQKLFSHDCYNQYLIELLINNKKFSKNLIFYDILLNNKISFNNLNYAIHFDSHLMASFLKKTALERGVTYIEGKVKNIKTSKNNNIDKIILMDGQSYKSDFIFDCTGFAKLFIGKHYKTKWKSYSNHLPMKKTIIIPNEKKQYFPYTKSIAMKNGWIFEIPLQHRTGRGYVFDSDYINEEQALKEAETFYKEKIKIKKVISFEAGTFEKVWVKNCMAVGLSSGFIEPLESTSLYLLVEQLEEFKHYIQFMFKEEDIYRNKFNELHIKNTDNILDFVYLHYMTKRKDSKFWKEFKFKNKMPETLIDKYESLKKGVLIYRNYTDNSPRVSFVMANYIYIAEGLGLLPKINKNLSGNLRPSLYEYGFIKDVVIKNQTELHKDYLSNLYI